MDCALHAQLVRTKEQQEALHVHLVPVLARLLLAAQALQAARATPVTTKSAPIRSPAKQNLALLARLGLLEAALCALPARTRM
jgi:hypothetical protein